MSRFVRCRASIDTDPTTAHVTITQYDGSDIECMIPAHMLITGDADLSSQPIDAYLHCQRVHATPGHHPADAIPVLIATPSPRGPQEILIHERNFTHQPQTELRRSAGQEPA